MDFRRLSQPILGNLDLSLYVTYGFVAFLAGIVAITKICRGPNLDAFPTAGSSSLFGTRWDVKSLNSIIQKGYDKYKSVPFKVADRYRWMVIVSNREHLEELSKVPEDQLSFLQSINDRINVHLTLGPDIFGIPYHIQVIRLRLTRNMDRIYPEIRDEIVMAFDEILNIRDDGWESVPALGVIQRVVSRANNRMLAGLSLSRNSDWIDLTLQFSFEIVKNGFLIGLFPKFLRSLAACFFTGVTRSMKHSLKYLGPIIEQRLQYLNEYGNEWAEKPNDLLSWLMDEAKGPQLTVEALAARLLAINFASIHSSSNSFTHALFYLAAHPQYIRPLREEVELIVEKEGWSKAAVGKMCKVDSFLRECQRMAGASSVTLTRKALKDFTFSDGTFIPKGATIAAPTRSLHYEEKLYENPYAFEPFRFANLDKEDGVTHQFVSTSIEYLPFGHGKHACPGRFFAGIELKTMLAHLVVTYDIKLEDNTPRPRSSNFGIAIMPDRNAKVSMRKRVNY